MLNPINLFMADAYAETSTTAAPQQGGGFSLMIMFVAFFAMIYFLMIRPQTKRAKEQQNLLNSLAKGDEVMSSGGLIGRITKISDQYIGLTIANNVEIILQKSAIVSLLPKGTLKSIEQS